MEILILVTGGTFDKEYNELTGELFFKDTHVAEMLKLGRNLLPVTVHTLMMIDSLNMTDADRKVITKYCNNAKQDHIIITHGTDTMAETARYIQNEIAEKTIILTGAMVPYKFGSSDGLFNLGSAMAFVQTLSKGVYIAMNGKCFTADNVRKDTQHGIFQEL
ncbi:asparaginase domain-containing protein [soil metagenome]